MFITVILDKRRLQVELNNNQTIQDVKHSLHQKFGIPLEEQHLFPHDNQEELSDEVQLRDLTNSVLNLRLEGSNSSLTSLQVVLPNGVRCQNVYHRLTTVGHIRNVVYLKMVSEGQNSVGYNNLVLKLADRVLCLEENLFQINAEVGSEIICSIPTPPPPGMKVYWGEQNGKH